jgi:O-antigen ligase
LAFISFRTIPSFSSRFKEVSVSNTNLPDMKNEDSFNLRTGILKCSLELIQENWFWGVGPGQVKSRLNACYDSIAPDVYKDKNFNTHNQFMGYWVGFGVLGPLLLLSLVAVVTIGLWKKSDWLGVCTCLLFLFAMQTENLLNRQHGIVTFCYFVGLHIFANSKWTEGRHTKHQAD